MVTFLAALTHIQLNLLGRFIYLDSVKAFIGRDDEKVPAQASPKTGLKIETERKFLTLSWYLLNTGWKDCVDRVRKAVDTVMRPVSLKESTTYDSLLQYLDQIRAQVDYVNGDPAKPFK